jgi:hypothetical protein
VDKIAKIMEELRHHIIDRGTHHNVSECPIKVLMDTLDSKLIVVVGYLCSFFFSTSVAFQRSLCL